MTAVTPLEEKKNRDNKNREGMERNTDWKRIQLSFFVDNSFYTEQISKIFESRNHDNNSQHMVKIEEIFKVSSCAINVLFRTNCLFSKIEERN